MPKSMLDLQTNGKEVTALSATDLMLAMTDPAGTPDDAVIEWDAIQELIISFMNYRLSPSVTSNNLTLAVKALDGNDASASNQIKIRVGNTIYTVSAAVSFTKNAGTNWCNAGGTEMAAQPIDFFVYAIGETGASAGLKFGFSRISHAVTMADFVNTSTDEKYIAGNWTNFNSTDAVTNIGRFRAQLSATASFNWSIATSKIISRPIYESDWLEWNPQASAGTMTYPTPTYSIKKYKLISNQVTAKVRASATTGGTATNTISLTLPFDALDAGSFPTGFGQVNDGGPVAGRVALRSGTPDLIDAVRYDNANYGLGAGRVVNMAAVYEI